MKWVLSFISVLILISVVIRIFVDSLLTKKLIEIFLLVLGILMAVIILFSSFSKNSLHLNNKFKTEVKEMNLWTFFSEDENRSAASSLKSNMQLPDQIRGMIPGTQFKNKALRSVKSLSAYRLKYNKYFQKLFKCYTIHTIYLNNYNYGRSRGMGRGFVPPPGDWCNEFAATNYLENGYKQGMQVVDVFETSSKK